MVAFTLSLCYITDYKNIIRKVRKTYIPRAWRMLFISCRKPLILPFLSLYCQHNVIYTMYKV